MRVDSCILGVYFMEDAEFLKMINDAEDCPDTLIKMAETSWQKEVAVEFVLQDKKINAQGHDIEVLKKITWGIFTLTAVACAVQVINAILPIL